MQSQTVKGALISGDFVARLFCVPIHAKNEGDWVELTQEVRDASICGDDLKLLFTNRSRKMVVPAFLQVDFELSLTGLEIPIRPSIVRRMTHIRFVRPTQAVRVCVGLGAFAGQSLEELP